MIIGLGGGSGSGKSWLASYLKRNLGARAAVVCLDWYYKDNGGLHPEKAAKLNFDHPNAIETSLLVRHLKKLARGQAIEAPLYDYATHSRLKQTQRVEPAPVIIVEGLFVLNDGPLRDLLDVGVYIDVPDDLRLLRRVKRDVKERRVDLDETLALYERCVRPMHLRFIEPGARKAKWVWRQLADRAFPAKLLKHVERGARASNGNGRH
ncbi:MAG: uridine kinase [Elusimicrobia bacterium]|nr:uridine kinase [Elusimicrobiota bacterium]